MTYPIAAGQAYFVVARDSGQTVPLSGPYDSHGAAARDVDAARAAVARKYPNDSRAAWSSYGVALVTVRRPIRTAFAVEELAQDIAEQNDTCAGCGQAIKRYGTDGAWFTDRYDCAGGSLHAPAVSR